MNNLYSINQESFTVSSVVLMGVLATQLTCAAAQAEPMKEDMLINNQPYQEHTQSSTLSQYNNPVGGVLIDNIDELLVASVTGFYEQLMYSQESLGNEFEQVLNDNIWDLYER